MIDTTQNQDKSIAVLTHVSGIVFGFIVPLIVWLVNRDNPEKQYLTTESAEALNFQITITIAYFVAGALIVAGIGLLLMPILWVLNTVFCIIAAIQTNNGVQYRYPLTLRLIK